MRVNVSKWSKRNLVLDDHGIMRVRPGIVDRYSFTSAVYAFSVRDEPTDEVLHYVVTHASSSTKVYVITDQFELIGYYDWSVSDPGHVSHCVVAGQVILTSENCPTLWWYTGAWPARADGKPWPDNPSLDPLDIPKGLVTEWAGRAVYYDGGQLYFSEGGEPRMLFADNVQNPPGGRVVGMHTMQGGALLLATTTGVWALNREAATAGDFIIGGWQKVTDYSGGRYGCTASAKGRIWGLTARGVRLIDSQSQAEFSLNDPAVPMTTSDPVSVPDYQNVGQLLEGELGLIVSVPDIQLSCMNDSKSQSWSWWDHTDGFSVVGSLRRRDGTWMVVTEDGIYTVEGTIEEDDATVYGVAVGRVPTPPIKSPVVREVHISTDSEENAIVAVRGEDKSASVPQSTPLWGTATYATSEWNGTELRSRRFRFATRTDDIAIEAGASGCGARIDSSIDVEIRGVGRKRPTN